jgi:Tfp pilus assembly protein PilN
MTTVNLIPEEIRIEKQRKKRLRFWVFITFVVLVLMLVMSGYQYLGYLRMDKDIEQRMEQNQKIQQEMSLLDTSQEKYASWQNQLVILRQMQEYPDLLSILGFLCEHTPAMIYLEEMIFLPQEGEAAGKTVANSSLPKSSQMFLINDTTDSEAKDPVFRSMVLRLEGKSLDYPYVADYLAALRSTGIFREVNLKRSWRETGPTSDTIYFTIECHCRV